MKEIKGDLVSKGKRYALIASRFNEFITGRLIEGAVDCFLRHGVTDDQLTLCRVPGSYDIPLVARRAAQTEKYAAVVCLGAVIRGDTPHFDYVASEAAKGVSRVSMETNVPVIFGIITADTLEQAIERAGTKAGNKGADAALSAIEMANLLEKIK